MVGSGAKAVLALAREGVYGCKFDLQLKGLLKNGGGPEYFLGSADVKEEWDEVMNKVNPQENASASVGSRLDEVHAIRDESVPRHTLTAAILDSNLSSKMNLEKLTQNEHDVLSAYEDGARNVVSAGASVSTTSGFVVRNHIFRS